MIPDFGELEGPQHAFRAACGLRSPTPVGPPGKGDVEVSEPQRPRAMACSRPAPFSFSTGGDDEIPAGQGGRLVVPRGYAQAVHRAVNKQVGDVHRLSRGSSTGSLGQVVGGFVEWARSLRP